MKTFILYDGFNNASLDFAERIIKGIPSIEFIKGDYSRLRTEEIIDFANICDLIHYTNFDIGAHLAHYKEIKTPFIYCVRSHNFPPYVYQVAKWSTKCVVVNEKLEKEIPNSVCIFDGVDMMAPKQKFIVGCAMKGDPKAVVLQKACDALGVELIIADENNPQEISQCYELCSLFVSLSLTEGFSKSTMECIGTNKPLLAARAGAHAGMNLHFIDEPNNVQSIVNQIEKFCTSRQLYGFTWETSLKKYKNLYNECVH